MNYVNQLAADHLAFTSKVGSAGEGVLIMDACSITALGIKQVLMESCGIGGEISFVQNLAGISSRIDSTPPALLIMDIHAEYL